MIRFISPVLMFFFVLIFEINGSHGKSDDEISLGLIPGVSSTTIEGTFRSVSGPTQFDFVFNKTFTFKLSKTSGFRDGAYEGSSCALTNTRTGKVIRQGNFMFYFNGTSCCYDVKLVAKNY